MDNKRRLTNKYILLAILLIAMFVLPSCRTRISNNSEITTVQYDESGFMSEDYQMRRDELGLSTAEKPLLPNFGSGESDDSEDFEEGESIDRRISPSRKPLRPPPITPPTEEQQPEPTPQPLRAEDRQQAPLRADTESPSMQTVVLFPTIKKKHT